MNGKIHNTKNKNKNEGQRHDKPDLSIVLKILWVSFLLLGGGVFLLYYSQIEYMPEFDLAASISVLAAASVTTAVIVAMLMFISVLPGLLWTHTWMKLAKTPATWPSDERAARRYCGTWFLGSILIAGATLATWQYMKWLSLLISLLALVATVIYLMYRKRFTAREALFDAIGLAAVSFTSTLFFALPLAVVLGHLKPDLRSSDTVEFLEISSIVISIVAVNAMTVVPPREINPVLWYAGCAAAVLYLSILATGGISQLPGRVMALYKFGNIAVNRLVASAEGCQILSLHGVSVELKENGLCIAKDLRILSRLGRQMYLESGAGTNAARFELAASEVLSWSVKPPIQKTFSRGEWH